MSILKYEFMILSITINSNWGYLRNLERVNDHLMLAKGKTQWCEHANPV